MVSDERYREVYSSEQGTLCLNCSKPKQACRCAADRRMQVRGDGNVRVRRETKGRGGKTVTCISGLALNKEELQTLLSELKRHIGGGGTEKDGVLELQGDHADLVIAQLQKRGIKARRAGG